MPKLLICVGCSGSGKSTYAKELIKEGWGEVNRDWWRFRLFTDDVQDWSLYKFTKEREKEVTAMCEATFMGWVAYKQNIVVSNTNLNQKDIDYWTKLGEENGYDVELKFFPATLTELMKRDSKRGRLAVGQEVLFKQWQKWLEISGARKYTPNEFKPKAILVDIDGTIALVNGRSHYEYGDKVLTDLPRMDVIDLVHTYAYTTGSAIICLSGRDGSCKEYTKQWLEDYSVEYDDLFMREAGDTRCDTIIKEEIFWEHVAPYYNVVASFEDRNRMVRKWKDLGIPLVIDVSLGYLEF